MPMPHELGFDLCTRDRKGADERQRRTTDFRADISWRVHVLPRLAACATQAVETPIGFTQASRQQDDVWDHAACTSAISSAERPS